MGEGWEILPAKVGIATNAHLMAYMNPPFMYHGAKRVCRDIVNILYMI